MVMQRSLQMSHHFHRSPGNCTCRQGERGDGDSVLAVQQLASHKKMEFLRSDPWVFLKIQDWILCGEVLNFIKFYLSSFEADGVVESKDCEELPAYLINN